MLAGNETAREAEKELGKLPPDIVSRELRPREFSKAPPPAVHQEKPEPIDASRPVYRPAPPPAPEASQASAVGHAAP